MRELNTIKQELDDMEANGITLYDTEYQEVIEELHDTLSYLKDITSITRSEIEAKYNS